MLYVRQPCHLPALAIWRGDGSYAKSLAQFTKTGALMIDDWRLAPLTDEGRRDLLEIFDDHHGTRWKSAATTSLYCYAEVGK